MYYLLIVSFLIFGQDTQAGGRLLLDFPDYCQEEFRCGTMMNLLCMYHRKRNSKFCGKILFETNQQLRQEIFHRVNSFRQILAGGGIPAFPEGASNMRQVSWDFQLEKMAEAWTLKYIDHLWAGNDLIKPCTKTEEFKDGTSILGCILGPEEVASDSVAIWTEKALPPNITMNFRPDPSNSSESYNEYATIVWAESFKMGCSIASCNPHGYRGKRPMDQITVIACLFGPKGNSPGKPVFKNGTACSKCPPGTNCKSSSVWAKLCARKKDFDFMDGPDQPQFQIAKLVAFALPLASIIVLILILVRTKETTMDETQKMGAMDDHSKDH